jgi:hypothetical protein
MIFRPHFKAPSVMWTILFTSLLLVVVAILAQNKHRGPVVENFGLWFAATSERRQGVRVVADSPGGWAGETPFQDTHSTRELRLGTALSLRENKRDRVLTVLPEPRLLIIVTKGKVLNVRSLKSMASVNFHSEEARVLTHHLLYAFNSLPTDTSGWRVSDKMPTSGGPEAFACCVGPGHPLLARIAADTTLSPMSYDDVDIDKLRVLIPLVTVQERDWHGLLSGGKSFHRPLVLSLIGLHPLVYGQECEACARVLQEVPDSAMPLNNLHARHLRMMDVTLERMRGYNTNKEDKTSVELFSSLAKPVRIAVEDGRFFFTPLPGAPDGVLQTHLTASVVQGVRLSEGDTVILPGLKDDPYVVTKAGDRGCTLVSHVHLKDVEVAYRDRKGARLTTLHSSDGLQLRVGDNVYWEAGAGRVTKVSEDGKIAVAFPADDDDDESSATHGECITHPWLRTRQECEADKSMGKPKAVGVWDSPCTKDIQCPFYQKNKRYRNYRGGCLAGFCELPIGLQRVGYRQYREDSKESFPYCHGCPGGEPDCCPKQQPTPDYAFVMDEIERSTPAGA